MKRVTAFISSARKGVTYEAVREFEKALKAYEELEFEVVFLSDYRLEFCRGSKMCFDKGEKFCPMRDDRDLLVEKLDASDGVIFAAPNYAFQLSASMKNLLDRLAFLFHRPRFFGRSFTAIVTQGFYGGRSIRKYLERMGGYFGFNPSKGCVLNGLEPLTEAVRQSNARSIQKAAARFYKGLLRPVRPPSLFRLVSFRVGRTNVRRLPRELYDYAYYRERGWFESDYFADVPIGPVKKLLGALVDSLGQRMIKQA